MSQLPCPDKCHVTINIFVFSFCCNLSDSPIGPLLVSSTFPVLASPVVIGGSLGLVVTAAFRSFVGPFDSLPPLSAVFVDFSMLSSLKLCGLLIVLSSPVFSLGHPSISVVPLS